MKINPSKKMSFATLRSWCKTLSPKLFKLTSALALLALTQTASSQSVELFGERAEVKTFISEMTEKHGFSEAELRKVFSSVRYEPSVLRYIAPAPVPSKRSWAIYRSRFVEPIRIREGLNFWQLHQSAVKRASAQSGVPESIIVSIIGVETLYGRQTGTYRVIDALTTLAFDYPRRAAFFREQLEQFLMLTRETQQDVFGVKGSFAGAIGFPQFMPSSIRRYGIDFDGDGKLDLTNSPVDAIGSVSRFLADHGWRTGLPTHFEVQFENDAKMSVLIDAGIDPSFSLNDLQKLGVQSGALDAAKLLDDEKLALIDLPNADDPISYWLGTQNFYVITRYNRSSFYAMAVIDLAAELAKGRATARPERAPKRSKRHSTQ
jgi:membrane-bound lytic murein transglycosylase B